MRSSNRRKFLFYAVIALVIAINTPLLTVFATQATRDRMAQVERERQEAARQERYFRNLLRDTNEEITRIMNELMELDIKMMDAFDALDDIEYSLILTELRIEYAEMELEEVQAYRKQQFAVFQSRLRAMQELGPIGHLELLFQAESFSDFLLRLENIRTIAQFDQEMVARLDEAEARHQAILEELTRAGQLILDLRYQQEEALVHLQNLIDERYIWVENLYLDIHLHQALIEIYELEQAALNRQFGELEVQLRREEDELARQAAVRRRQEQLARLNNFQGRFSWPIPTHAPGARGFGVHMHPVLRVYRMHTGIDVSAPTGTRIYAAAEGYVRFVGWMGGYGNTVIIDHGNGYSTLYAHISRFRVREGQHVNAMQHIADVGSTGVSASPHLHFEIRRHNVAVDPMAYFN